MVTRTPFSSSTFRLVARGLIELHKLIRDGKDDSADAESVRDALDAPLKALNELEKRRAQWLSEDLYSVSEILAGPPREMNSQAQQELNEALESRQRGEWDHALDLLRRWREHISPALLSYLRGSVWLEAGHFDVAAEFFRHASECDPNNANYRAIYLHALKESDTTMARDLARQVLADHEKHAPVVVARSADILFNQTRTTSDAESSQLFHKLIPILERNMTRIEQEEGTASRVSAYAMSVGLLGFCHEFLGNIVAAVNDYSRGLRANPNNDGLLVARGILLYGSSPHAIADLERAAGLESPVIWPYLFLAHHYLITDQFDRCRIMCEAGLRMRGSDTAKSQLEEWRAIAQAELGFSPELIRESFEAAIRLDPSNDLARRNQAAFDESLRSPAQHPIWDQKTEADIRLFGLAERRYSLAA